MSCPEKARPRARLAAIAVLAATLLALPALAYLTATSSIAHSFEVGVPVVEKIEAEAPAEEATEPLIDKASLNVVATMSDGTTYALSPDEFEVTPDTIPIGTVGDFQVIVTYYADGQAHTAPVTLKANLPHPKQAFAVYSADDRSLTFYEREGMPKEGGFFLGKPVTNVYTGFMDASFEPLDIPWAGIRSQVVSVAFADALAPRNIGHWFYSFSAVTSFDLSALDGSRLESMAHAFSGCYSLESIDLSSIDAPNLKSLEAAFAEDSNLKAVQLPVLDKGSLTTLARTFSGCSALESVDLSGISTQGVESFYATFDGCKKLAAIDVSGFVTSSASTFEAMFRYCSSLTTLDVTGFDTSAGTSIRAMFDNCSSLTELDVSSFDTSNVEDMAEAFQCLRKVTVLDLSSFDTSKASSTASMFYGDTVLETIYVDAWSKASLTRSSLMFSGCPALVGGNGTTFVSGNTDGVWAVIDAVGTPGYFTHISQQGAAESLAYAALYGTTRYNYALVFGNASDVPDAYKGLALKESWRGIEEGVCASSSEVPWSKYAADVHDVAFLDEIRPEGIAWWFYGFSNVMTNTTLEGLANLNTERCTSMKFAFGGYKCRVPSEIKAWTSSADTSACTDMNGVFYQFGQSGICGFSDIDASRWDTSNVTNMAAMFSGCAIHLNYQEFHAENWNTSKVTNMASMFYGASIARYYISNWDVSNVTNMASMFWGGCKNANSVSGIEGWKPSSAVNMTKMFYGNTNLAIDLSSWPVPNVTTHDSFTNSPDLTEPSWVA